MVRLQVVWTVQKVHGAAPGSCHAFPKPKFLDSEEPLACAATLADQLRGTHEHLAST